ncbi:hypothetical protein ACWKT5_01455 [Streptomyces avermitilis]
MGVHVEADRDFWRGELVAGGFTATPRWTLHPVAGVVDHEAPIPEDVVGPWYRPAEDLAVPLGPAPSAAHARVLAALSGEREAVSGGHYVLRTRPTEAAQAVPRSAELSSSS